MNLVFVFLYLIFDIYRDFKIFLFCFILCFFNRVLAFVSIYIYIVEKFVRFITFLFKDEPVPAVLFLAFRFVVKKFLDFPFFLYFFLFRRCFSRRRKILNLFSCFLSLYFTRIFYRLSFSLHFFLSLSKNFQIFSLHRTFLSSSSISSSSKRILVLVTINYWKIFSFFFFFS